MNSKINVPGQQTPSTRQFPSKNVRFEHDDAKDGIFQNIDFDLEHTAQAIVSYRCEKENNIALQFPDSLLHYAPTVTQLLSTEIDQIVSLNTNAVYFVYVLGDTSYGECCVDEVAAQHLDTHLIVHYGNACLSPTRTLPVLYVFPRRPIRNGAQACDVVRQAVEQSISLSDVKRLVILYDVELYTYFDQGSFRVGQHCIDFTMWNQGKQVDIACLRFDNVLDIQLPHALENRADSRTESSNLIVGPLLFDVSHYALSHTAFIWFTEHASGDDCPAHICNAALSLCSGEEPSTNFRVVSLTSDAGSEANFNLTATGRVNKLLRKRFAQLNKLNEAERIGIVAGTLGISGNTDIIDRCKQVIEYCGKHAYIMLVGKLNATKLANFVDIDAFVLVSCPQNALLDDTREFMQPIVTPLELEAALLSDGDIFSSRYNTDFADLLRKPLVLERDGVEAQVTTIESNLEGTLATRDDWSVTVNGSGGGADFLRARTWQGLAYDQGGTDNDTHVDDLALDARKGQDGIASRYDRELS